MLLHHSNKSKKGQHNEFDINVDKGILSKHIA